MSVPYIGDRAQHFTALRQGAAMKSDLGRLSASLASGRVGDLTQHLDGQTAAYSGLEHRLAQLAGYQQVTRATDQLLGGVQTVLGRVDHARGQLAQTLLSVTAAQIDSAAGKARQTLDDMVTTLNTRLNDRALLAGQDVTATPLIPAGAMMADLQAVIGQDRSLAGITAAVTAWFDDPAGGFARTAYQGDATGLLQRRIAADRQIDIALRADDPAIRATLKATALAALAADLPGLGADAKTGLVRAAGSALFGAGSGLAGAQARIGGAQADLAETQAALAAQAKALTMARDDLARADPFETATKLLQLQSQLESHYTVIGRLSQLSLSRFI